VRCAINQPDSNRFFIVSEMNEPTLYFSYLKMHAEELKAKDNSIIFVNSKYIYGLLGNPGHLNHEELMQSVRGENPKRMQKNQISIKVK